MRFIKSAFYCLLCICFFPENTLAQQMTERPVLTVLEFDAVDITKSEVQEFTDYLSFVLRQTEEYQVIDRERREQILREREFMREDRTDENYQKRIGAEIGADQILTGKIHGQEDGYTLEVKLIEIEGGRILNLVSRRYAGSQELFDDCPTLIRELFQEQIQPRRVPQYTLCVGLLSGLGFLRDEPDNGFSRHIPVGAYVELIYPRGTVFLYEYWGFIRGLAFVELSYGHRFGLFKRMKLIPFAGISFFVLGDPKDDEPPMWIAVNGGINLEFVLHDWNWNEKSSRKSYWKLNIRANCSLPFYDGERLIDSYSDALLYLIISTGYTL